MEAISIDDPDEILPVLKFHFIPDICGEILQYIDTTAKISAINTIALLARDIRGSWNMMYDRVDAIRILCTRLRKWEWIDRLDEGENKEYLFHDGRWFRDEWNGPYEQYDADLISEKDREEFFDLLCSPDHDDLRK